jgi:integrase
MENISKWLMKVGNSNATRNSYQNRIMAFAKYMKEHFNIDIETLKDAYREAKYKGEMEREKFLDKLHDAIEDYVCFVKTQKFSNMHVKLVVSIVSSYVKKGCGIKDIEIDIPKRTFPIFHNRDITKEEIKTILEHATLRDRTFFLMMVESGLRPSTLLALRYKYIKQDFEKNVIPMKIELPSELLKDRIEARFSFIGEDGFKVLKEFLSTRKSIGDNDFLFLPERPGSAKGDVPSESAMSNKFNRIILKLGLDTPIGKGKPKSLRLYNLRKYFFNNMKCDSAYRSYWFCHKSIDDHYISTQEDKHREEYAKGYKFLRVFQATDVDVRIEALTNELKAKDQRILELEKKLSNEIEHIVASVKSQHEALKTLKERMDRIKESKKQKET